MKSLTIGKVAQASGVGVETIRFYEREGLLSQPARRQSGYRQYEPDAILKLRFIKQAQRLGFTLREIKELLAMKLDPEAACAQIREGALTKMADIDQRINELKRMKKALAPLIRACDGKGKVDGCPILNAIEKPCNQS